MWRISWWEFHFLTYCGCLWSTLCLSPKGVRQSLSPAVPGFTFYQMWENLQYLKLSAVELFLPSVRHVFPPKISFINTVETGSQNQRKAGSTVALKLCCTASGPPAGRLVGWGETWTPRFWKAPSGIPMCTNVWESWCPGDQSRLLFCPSDALQLDPYGPGAFPHVPALQHSIPHLEPWDSQCPTFSWISLRQVDLWFCCQPLGSDLASWHPGAQSN